MTSLATSGLVLVLEYFGLSLDQFKEALVAAGFALGAGAVVLVGNLLFDLGRAPYLCEKDAKEELQGQVIARDNELERLRSRLTPRLEVTCDPQREPVCFVDTPTGNVHEGVREIYRICRVVVYNRSATSILIRAQVRRVPPTERDRVPLLFTDDRDTPPRTEWTLTANEGKPIDVVDQIEGTRFPGQPLRLCYTTGSEAIPVETQEIEVIISGDVVEQIHRLTINVEDRRLRPLTTA